MKIPEGWPTREMRGAADAYLLSCCVSDTGKVQSNKYHLPPSFKWEELLEIMLAAAPTAPAQSNEELLRKLMEQAQVFASAWSLVGGPFDSGNAISDAEEAKAELEGMLREAITTPPAQEADANVCTSTSPDAHKTGNIDDKQEINYALISKHRELGWTVSDSVYKAHIAQVLPLQKQPEVTVTTTAQEAEPYAYAYKSSSDPRPSVYFEKMDFFPPSIQEIPLYTNAPSDKLRQAAEEAEQLMRGANLIVIADMLRAALEGE